MTELQKGVQEFMKTGDNVAFVNTLKADMYAKLADNQEFAALASDIEKYSGKYDSDPELYKAVDDKTA